MENFKNLEESGNDIEVIKNNKVEIIEKINSEYAGKAMFPLGKIETVSYADLGNTLTIYLSGDVPTNFNPNNIIIVHPDSEKSGWIGKGKIGFTLGGDGVDISKIPLPVDTINTINNIYQEYVGKEPMLYLNREDDTSKFANMGLYKDIVSKSK